jgi:hypothetical protein
MSITRRTRITMINENKKTTTYADGNPCPDLGQA